MCESLVRVTTAKTRGTFSLARDFDDVRMHVREFGESENSKDKRDILSCS